MHLTKFQALQSFFSGFGIPAIEENSFYSSTVVPEFPYITYNVQTSDFLDGEVTLNPSVWYKTYSWQEPEEKASEISQAIGRGGKIVPCEDGYIWIKRGSPFCIPMGDESDKFIKRMYLNIIVEFFTTD
jgi:hypothetical protein